MAAVILAGMGDWGSGWYDGLKKRFAAGDVVVVAPDPATPQRMRAADRWYASLVAALENESPRFLINATPPHVHTELNVLAVGRGVPVLCEKPIAPTLDESRRMVAVAKAAAVPFFIGENFRRAAVMRRAAELIRGGAIGKLAGMHCQLFQHLRTDKPYWGKMKHAFLEDVGVHVFDLARFFATDEGARILARSFNPPESWHPTNAAASVLMEMRGGAIFTFNGGLATIAARTGWMGDWRLEGSAGTILIRGDALTLATAVGEVAEDHSTTVVPGVLDDFLALLEGAPIIDSLGEDYLRTQELAHYAVLSAESRDYIAIPHAGAAS